MQICLHVCLIIQNIQKEASRGIQFPLYSFKTVDALGGKRDADYRTWDGLEIWKEGNKSSVQLHEAQKLPSCNVASLWRWEASQNIAN